MEYKQSKIPLLVLDSNLLIIDMSDSAELMLALRSSEFIGKPFAPMILDGSEGVEGAADSVALVIPSEVRLSIEHLLESMSASERPENTRFSALILPLILSEADNFDISTVAARYIVILSPCVEDAALKDSQAQTEVQKSKLEALGTLAGGIAHDLNNLLMAVLGHLSYLRLSKAVSNEDSLLAAEEGARTAARLSQQILDFARRQDVADEWVDLNKIVQSVIPLVVPTLPSTVQVACSGSRMPLPVLIDEPQITQIVLNLILNARDAMPQGGQIQVDLDSMRLADQTSINGCDLKEGAYARIQVSDTGHGMVPEVKTRIFEPFFTTKRGTGTGLGLATVFFLVKALKGAIRVDSEVGAGTVFTVLLPLADPSDKQKAVGSQSISTAGTHQKKDNEAPRPKSLDQISASDGVTKKILVVDDEDSVRMVLQRSLELLGYEVLVAENGDEALSIFTEAADSIALVVMDMIMPKMAGHELFFKLKEHSPSVKVLISSGYASDKKTQDLLKNGAVGFIQKPFAIEELASEVSRCII